MDSLKHVKRLIKINVCESEKKQLAEKIHKQLVGNQDYIESSILLNCDFPETIMIWIFNECENIPEITI